MTLTKYPSILFLFYVLWAMALLLAMTAPENKYEWMIEVDPSISRSKLPEDPDADIGVLLFCLPAIVFSLLNFTLSKWVFENRNIGVLSVLAGLLMLLTVTIKIL